MGQSKEMYMEMVTAEFEREQFERMVEDQGLISPKDYTIKTIDVPNYEYSNNEQWQNQKKIANKEFKKLKEIEYNIRNKKA